MVLYAYVCVCTFSLRRESPGRILGDKPLLFSGGSVTQTMNVILPALDVSMGVEEFC
jgi:hypothetical protein